MAGTGKSEASVERSYGSNMSMHLFRRFRHIIHEACGIELAESKITLLSTRVAKRMRSLNVPKYKDYLEILMADTSGQELKNLVNVVTTNVSQLFRLPRHFDVLKDHYTACQEKGQSSYCVWSAACASGEEPYSIAMVLKEWEKEGMQTRVLATDIASDCIEKARLGQYPAKVVEHVPVRYRQYLQKRMNHGAPSFTVSPTLKEIVTFGQVNLAYPPFPLRGPFDVIFCSNVMIYFNNEVRMRLLEAIYELLAPGGLLMVGSAEGLAGLISRFKPIEPSIYQRPENP